MSIHCTYHKWYKGEGTYQARCAGMSGGFKTVAAVKAWARKIAKARKTTVTFEHIK